MCWLVQCGHISTEMEYWNCAETTPPCTEIACVAKVWSTVAVFCEGNITLQYVQGLDPTAIIVR